MTATVQGEWPSTIHRDRGYFDLRETWLDCRGTVEIASTSHFGFQVMVITDSHDLDPTIDDGLGAQLFSTVEVGAHAWICNRAILYNCRIMPHAVVGAGAVVKGVVIPSWMLAEGNPAMLVAAWVGGKWLGLAVPERPPNIGREK